MPTERFVRSRLIAHARNQRDQRRKIPTIQVELGNFFTSDRAGEFGRLRLHLRHVLALHDDFCADGADFERHVDASLLADIEFHFLGLILLEAGRGDNDVIGARGQGGLVVFAGGVGRRLAVDAALRTGDHDRRARQRRSRRILHRAGNRSGSEPRRLRRTSRPTARPVTAHDEISWSGSPRCAGIARAFSRLAVFSGPHGPGHLFRWTLVSRWFETRTSVLKRMNSAFMGQPLSRKKRRCAPDHTL